MKRLSIESNPNNTVRQIFDISVNPKLYFKPQLYIWMEDSKLVNLQTIDDFELTGIKLTFENDIQYSLQNQNNNPLIIDKNWDNISNSNDKSIYFYGDASAAKKISSNTGPSLFYVTNIINSISSISDTSDGFATALNDDLVIIDKPENVFVSQYIIYHDYTNGQVGYRDIELSALETDPTIGVIKYKFVNSDGDISAEQTQQITEDNKWYGHGNDEDTYWSYFTWKNDAMGYRWSLSDDWTGKTFIVETNLEIHTSFKLESNKLVISSPVVGNAKLTIGNNANNFVRFEVSNSETNYLLLGSLSDDVQEQNQYLWNDATKTLGWKRFGDLVMKNNSTFTNNSSLVTNNNNYVSVSIDKGSKYYPMKYGSNLIEYVWNDSTNMVSNKWANDNAEIIDGSYKFEKHSGLINVNSFKSIDIINGLENALNTMNYKFNVANNLNFTTRTYTLNDDTEVDRNLIISVYFGKYLNDIENKYRILTIDDNGDIYEGRDTNGPFGANGFETLRDFVEKNGNLVLDWLISISTVPIGWTIGDPHITTLTGLKYDFKHLGAFRMFDNNHTDPEKRIVINGYSECGPKSRFGNDLDYSTHDFIKKIYIKCGYKEILLDCGFIGEKASIIYNLGFDIEEFYLDLNRITMLKTCFDCGDKWKMRFKTEQDMINHKNQTNHNVPDTIRNQIKFNLDNGIDNIDIIIQNVNINNRLPCGILIKVNNILDGYYTGAFINRKYSLTCKLNDMINIDPIDEPENYNEDDLPKYEKPLRKRMTYCNEDYHFN